MLGVFENFIAEKEHAVFGSQSLVTSAAMVLWTVVHSHLSVAEWVGCLLKFPGDPEYQGPPALVRRTVSPGGHRHAGGRRDAAQGAVERDGVRCLLAGLLRRHGAGNLRGLGGCAGGAPGTKNPGGKGAQGPRRGGFAEPIPLNHCGAPQRWQNNASFPHCAFVQLLLHYAWQP